jgi:hypothetical protein
MKKKQKVCKLKRRLVVAVFLTGLASNMAWATITTINSIADTFVLNPGSGATSPHASADNNYGAAGSLSVASATAAVDGYGPKGEFITLLEFNFSSFTDVTVTELSLTVTLNNGNSSAGGIFNFHPGCAGDFDILWFDFDWEEGTGAPHSDVSDGITYNSLMDMLNTNPADYLETFYYGDYDGDGENDTGTYTYLLDLSNGYYSDLLDAIAVGDSLTLMLMASEGSDVTFNIGGRNNAYLTVTAIPEPTSMIILLAGSAVLFKTRRKKL